MTVLYEWLSKSAKAQGNNKAVVYRDNYVSWRGLLQRVDRRAEELKGSGIGTGAWVGLMLGNVTDFVVLSLALSKLGATIVPIDPTTGSRELELMIQAAPLRALINRPRGSEGAISATGASIPPPIVQPKVKPGKGILAPQPSNVVDTAESRKRLINTLLTCSVYKPRALPVKFTPVSVLFTADSLGDPKAVLRNEKNTIAAADNTIAALGLTQKSRILTAVPLLQAFGWDVGLLPVLRLGATMYLEEEISARRIAKLVREHDIDVLPGTPAMFAEMTKLPVVKQVTVKDPRWLSSGSKLETSIAEEFHKAYGVRLQSLYHTTDASIISLEGTGKAPSTVGAVVDHVNVKLTLADGKPAGAKEGLIWVKSKAVAEKSVGPFDAEAPKAGLVPIGETDKDGWLRTGDLGKQDKAGKLTITGREDDTVKIDGKRVALGEIEGCLEAFPNVKAAKAVAMSDSLGGMMIIARVSMKAKCKPEEIIDHCARNLAPYKVPRRVEFSDAL